MRLIDWDKIAKESKWLRESWDLCKAQGRPPTHADMIELKQLYRDGLTPDEAVNKLIGGG